MDVVADCLVGLSDSDDSWNRQRRKPQAARVASCWQVRGKFPLLNSQPKNPPASGFFILDSKFAGNIA